MFAVTLVILFAHAARGAEYAYGTVSPWTGEIIPMDIELHNKTMLTYPGTPDPPLACFSQTINFHDFTRGLVAMKAVGKNVCYIKTSDETYEKMKEIVDRINNGETDPYMQATEEWDVPETPVPDEEVSERVGERIANFCTGCKVYIFEDGKVLRAVADVPRVTTNGRDKSSLPKRTKRGNCWLCIGCIVIA